MSRSCIALMTLLASLAGPLVFAPAARSEQPTSTCPAEAYGGQAVCTPPAVPMHPADNYGFVPYPGYAGEYADADAAASWTAETPVASDASAVEDWRDFVIEFKSSSITNRYDDLFDSMVDYANQTMDSLPPTIVEADADGYKADSSELAEYDPYGAESEAKASSEYASIEAYESEFSGYGKTDYLRDNFDYRPQPAIITERGLVFARLARSWAKEVLRSDLVTDVVQMGSEAWYSANEAAAEVSIDQIVEASELAWDRLEEYNRLTSLPVPKLDACEVGYRLAGDDCGWDCWSHSTETAVTPTVPASTANQQREAARAVALSLRRLALQLESASEWVAGLGGIDVAELKSVGAAR
jgi:hypothetical protein